MINDALVLVLEQSLPIDFAFVAASCNDSWAGLFSGSLAGIGFAFVALERCFVEVNNWDTRK